MPAGQTNAQIAAALAARIIEQARRGAGKGLNAARIFLTARIKETLSVPAPPKRVRTRAGGNIYYRATTRATPGAPPRKLSGHLRRSITSRMAGPYTAIIGTNVIYARRHELGKGAYKHQFLMPTAKKYKNELRRIIGRAVRAEVVAP